MIGLLHLSGMEIPRGDVINRTVTFFKMSRPLCASIQSAALERVTAKAPYTNPFYRSQFWNLLNFYRTNRFWPGAKFRPSVIKSIQHGRSIDRLFLLHRNPINDKWLKDLNWFCPECKLSPFLCILFISHHLRFLARQHFFCVFFSFFNFSLTFFVCAQKHRFLKSKI